MSNSPTPNGLAVRAKEIRWLTVHGEFKTLSHRAFIYRAEDDRVFAVWGQTVAGNDPDDVDVKLGGLYERHFRVSCDTYFRVENANFYAIEDVGDKIGECPWKLYPKFERLCKRRISQLSSDETAVAPTEPADDPSP